MVYLRINKKGDKYYFSLYESRRIKRGKNRGKVVTRQVEKIGNSKELLRRILEKREEPFKNVKLAIKDSGALIALHDAAKELGIGEVLRKHIKKGREKKAKLMEIIVLNKAIEPKAKSQIGGWYKTTVLPDLIGLSPEKVYTESLCSVLDDLPTKSINSVLYDLLKRSEALYGVDYTKLLMDATAVYFEGDRCILLSFGYNPVYKNKKQIIVFLAITELEKFPVMLKIERGNTYIAKKTVEMASYLKRKFGLSGVTIMIDNGFITARNVKEMGKRNIYFLSRLEKGNLIAKTAIKLSEGKFADTADSKGRKASPVFPVERIIEEMRASKKKKEELRDMYMGLKVVVISTTDEEGREKDFSERIERMERNLDAIRAKCERSKKKQYDATIVQIYEATKGLRSFVLFSLEQDENSGKLVFTYKLKEKAIKERKNSFDKFVIITDRDDLSNDKMLEYYISKYPIEDAYRTLKSDMEVDTPNHFLASRVKVDLLLSVISYFLWMILQLKFRKMGEKGSIKDILHMLHGLKVVTTNEGVSCFNDNNRAIQLLNSLNKELSAGINF
jgi:transposase